MAYGPGVALIMVGYVLSWTIPYGLGRLAGARWAIGATLVWAAWWTIDFRRSELDVTDSLGVAVFISVPWGLATLVGSRERRRLT